MNELENPKLQNSGCYRSVCVAIDVEHIALNAVLKFDFINELEEVTDFGFEFANLSSEGSEKWTVLSEDVTRAFRLLKVMMNNWLLDG